MCFLYCLSMIFMLLDGKKTFLDYHKLKDELRLKTRDLTDNKKKILAVIQDSWTLEQYLSQRKEVTTAFKENHRDLLTKFHELAKANRTNETVFQELFNKAKSSGRTDLDMESFRSAITWWGEKEQPPKELEETNKQEQTQEQVQEHKEIITPEDVSVYIHGNPLWHIVVGEKEDAVDDKLLTNRYFQRYYDWNRNERVFVKHIQPWSIEYTITIPSIEHPQPSWWWRPWWYIWISIILKNWYKIKGTWDIPLNRWIDYTNGNSLIKRFMKWVIAMLLDQWLTKHISWSIQRQVDDKKIFDIRKILFDMKTACLNSFNDPELDLLEEEKLGN